MDEPSHGPIDPSAPEAEPAPHPEGHRRMALGTAAAGVAFAVLFVVSTLALTGVPGPRASNEALAAFYGGDGARRLVIVGLYGLPLSSVAFLWFVAVLREWVAGSARRLNRVLANVQLLSGVAFITLSFAAAAATIVAATTTQFAAAPLDPDAARQFPLFGSALLYVFAMRMAAIFVTSTTGIVRATGRFPGWFVWGSYAVAAVLFLVATLGAWLVVVFPAWVAVLSLLVAAGARRDRRP